MEDKKAAIIRILQILEKESDENHKLTQQQIAEKLSSRYGISLERKAIGRDIETLINADYSISQDKKGSYYDERLFDQTELRLLIDSVLASNHINDRQSSSLIDRLAGLGGPSFKSYSEKIQTTNNNRTDNNSLFFNIQVITEAIKNKRNISFNYYRYAANKKLANPKFHDCVSPLKLILHNQHYYLHAFDSNHNGIVNFRLDKINDINNLDSFYRRIEDSSQINSTMPYLFTDEPKLIEFEIKNDIHAVDTVVDWFGKDVKIRKNTTNSDVLTCEIKTSPTAMTYWAMQYTELAEIKKPLALREEINMLLKNATDKYSN